MFWCDHSNNLFIADWCTIPDAVLVTFNVRKYFRWKMKIPMRFMNVENYHILFHPYHKEPGFEQQWNTEIYSSYKEAGKTVNRIVPIREKTCLMSSENRHCALNISSLFVRFSSNVYLIYLNLIITNHIKRLYIVRCNIRRTYSLRKIFSP